MSKENDARAYELLRAAFDIFNQQAERGFLEATECTAVYDGGEFDAFCLCGDIAECLRKHDEEEKSWLPILGMTRA